MSIAKLIKRYIQASDKLEASKQDCDSSWGYFLHEQIAEVDTLEIELSAEFEKLAYKAVLTIIQAVVKDGEKTK